MSETRKSGKGKRVLKIVLIVVAVILVLAAVWWFFLRDIINVSNGEGRERVALTGQTEALAAGEFVMQELSFQRDGMNIYGEVYLPGDGSGIYPMVIIGHEFSASHISVEPYAKRFAEAGIGAYIFDFCGGGYPSKSDGTMTEMSALTESRDLKAIFDGIKGQPFTDRENIFLMGCSQGGLVAAITAPGLQDQIQGLILYYPALFVPGFAQRYYRSADRIPETINVYGYEIGAIYYADLLELNMDEIYRSFDRDVQIIHGSKDSMAPFSVSRHAADVYPSAELISMKGADHVFQGEDIDTAADLTISFLKDHIR